MSPCGINNASQSAWCITNITDRLVILSFLITCSSTTMILARGDAFTDQVWSAPPLIGLRWTKSGVDKADLRAEKIRFSLSKTGTLQSLFVSTWWSSIWKVMFLRKSCGCHFCVMDAKKMVETSLQRKWRKWSRHKETTRGKRVCYLTEKKKRSELF